MRDVPSARQHSNPCHRSHTTKVRITLGVTLTLTLTLTLTTLTLALTLIITLTLTTLTLALTRTHEEEYVAHPSQHTPTQRTAADNPPLSACGSYTQSPVRSQSGVNWDKL